MTPAIAINATATTPAPAEIMGAAFVAVAVPDAEVVEEALSSLVNHLRS